MVVVVQQIPQTTTTNDLPSVEKALQKLNDTLFSLETRGLDRAETKVTQRNSTKLHIEKTGTEPTCFGTNKLSRG